MAEENGQQDPVRVEVEAAFKGALNGGLGVSGANVFEAIFRNTIGTAPRGSDWGKAKKWVLGQVKRIAKCAQKNAGPGNKVEGSHLADAAECLIPAIKAMCDVTTPTDQAAPLGDWCVNYERWTKDPDWPEPPGSDSK